MNDTSNYCQLKATLAEFIRRQDCYCAT